MGSLRTVEPSLMEPWVKENYRELQDTLELSASYWVVWVPKIECRPSGQTQVRKPASPRTSCRTWWLFILSEPWFPHPKNGRKRLLYKIVKIKWNNIYQGLGALFILVQRKGPVPSCRPGEFIVYPHYRGGDRGQRELWFLHGYHRS